MVLWLWLGGCPCCWHVNYGGGQISPRLSSGPPGVFYAYFYNHAHRPRLEKLLYLVELSRSSNGYLKPLLGPGDGFTSETVARQFQK
jgi:hypothetical protein